MRKALEDVVVLDLGQIYNGPYCTLMLAYQGAKVIKIEPIEGEVLRRRRNEPHEFLMVNSNKYGVAINLKESEGKDLFLEMVKKADVVVENFAPNVMNRLGLDYDILQEVNPRIIYATGKGYGLEGPYANLPAMDLTIQAIGGVMTSTGYPDGPPVKAGPAVVDFMGGIHLFGGILTALYQRERTGRGQLVEVSMHDTMYPVLASPLGAYYDGDDELPQRTGNRHSGLSEAPYNVYPAKDGYIAILCMSEKHWENLVKCIGREELLTDSRFITKQDRVRNMDLVDEIISSFTKTQKKMDVLNTITGFNVPCAPVLSIAEVADDKHLKYRKMIREVEHPNRGKVRVPGSPIRLSDSPLEDVRVSPKLGEHTNEILKELVEINQDKLEELRKNKIIL
nr:CoA transferase [Fredinandcohnia onubensis]